MTLPYQTRTYCAALVSTAFLLTSGIHAQTTAPTQDAASTETTESNDVIILSEFAVNTTKDKGYRASNSVSGSRFNTAIKDLPFALQAFTNEFITDIHPSNLYDVALYSPGVVYRSSDFNDGNTALGIRGFATSVTLRDGMRGPPILEFSNVERMEIVKGPASFLYGQITPGGVANVITKAPKEKFEGAMTATYGSYGEYSGMIDITGPATKGLFYRAIYSYSQDMHYWKPYDSKQWDFAPQILYKLNEKATLRLTYEKFQKDESPQLFQKPQYGGPRSGLPSEFAAQNDPIVGTPVIPVGLPSWATTSNDPNLSGVVVPGLPKNFNQMANSDYRHSKDTTWTASLDVKADEHWNIRVAYGYDKNVIDMVFSGRPVANPNINAYTAAYNARITAGDTPQQAAAHPSVLANSGFAQPRRWRWQTYDKVSNTFETQALGNYQLGGISLKMLLGAQYNPYSFRAEAAQAPDSTNPVYNPTGPLPPWDLRNPATWMRDIPTFSRSVTSLNGFGTPAVNNSITRNLDEAIYAGATWGFFNDDLLVLTGIRRTYTSIQTENDFDTNTLPGSILKTVGTEFKADKNTPQLGVLYKARKDLSLFASYSESFVPATGTLTKIDKSNPSAWTTVPGDAIQPTEGSGYDFGVKTDLFEGRLSATLSYYQVTNSNIVSSIPETGPNGIFFATYQSGEQQSKGYELDITLTPIDNWQIYASGSIQDATQTIVVSESEDARLLGINTLAGYNALPTNGDKENWRNVWNLKGKPIQMTAPHSYNLWTKYEFKNALKGLFVGGGANIMRDQTIFPQTESRNHQTYTLWNAMIGYSTNVMSYPVTVTVNGKNLTDEEYLPSQNTQSRPREIILSVSTRF